MVKLVACNQTEVDCLGLIFDLILLLGILDVQGYNVYCRCFVFLELEYKFLLVEALLIHLFLILVRNLSCQELLDFFLRTYQTYNIKIRLQPFPQILKFILKEENFLRANLVDEMKYFKSRSLPHEALALSRFIY